MDRGQGNCQVGIQVSEKRVDLSRDKGEPRTLKRPSFSKGLERLKKVDLALNWRLSLEGQTNEKAQATEGPEVKR